MQNNVLRQKSRQFGYHTNFTSASEKISLQAKESEYAKPTIWFLDNMLQAFFALAPEIRACFCQMQYNSRIIK